MKNQIVTIHRNEPRVSSWIIKDGYEIEHRAIRRLVKKYKSDFNELGLIATDLQKVDNKIGRPVEVFLLNEEQTYFLGTLLPNTQKVVSFKLTLVKNFSIAKKALLQKAMQQKDTVWLAQRQAGKITHLEKTDTIKEFVEYAISQGSGNASRYYTNIAKMQNQALFLLEQKFKNIRDILDLNQLATVNSADAIVERAITEGMTNGLHYKEIYKLAKSRIETFAELRGKTFIPATQQLRLQQA